MWKLRLTLIVINTHVPLNSNYYYIYITYASISQDQNRGFSYVSGRRSSLSLARERAGALVTVQPLLRITQPITDGLVGFPGTQAKHGKPIQQHCELWQWESILQEVLSFKIPVVVRSSLVLLWTIFRKISLKMRKF